MRYVNTIEEGRKIPLVDVFNYVGININSNNKSLCPFHSDKTPSLSIWKDKNMYKCFVCDAKGDAITFWNNYYNINNYITAAIDICYVFNIITLEEKETLLEKTKNKSFINYNKTNLVSKNYNYIKEDMSFDEIIKAIQEKESTLKIANEETLDKVYSIFIDECYLSEAHRKHLSINRQLTDKEIKDYKFFTMPKFCYDNFLNTFYKKLKEANIELETLSKVPGFFFNKVNNRYEFFGAKALGIPIIYNNKIIRIQLRRDESDVGSKYFWFSSSFATEDNPKYINGTCAGSPSLILTKEKEFDTIIITEGYFKALKLVNTRKCASISVQGVNNWMSTIPLIKELEKTNSIKNIIIAFDIDYKFNSKVYKSSMDLSKACKQKYNTSFLNWNSSYGKGIDDVINNNRIKDVRIVKVEKLKRLYENIEKLIVLYTKQPINDNIRKQYFELIEAYGLELIEKFIDDLNNGEIPQELKAIFNKDI